MIKPRTGHKDPGWMGALEDQVALGRGCAGGVLAAERDEGRRESVEDYEFFAVGLERAC